jgi:hypothetical protein
VADLLDPEGQARLTVKKEALEGFQAGAADVRHPLRIRIVRLQNDPATAGGDSMEGVKADFEKALEEAIAAALATFEKEFEAELASARKRLTDQETSVVKAGVNLRKARDTAKSRHAEGLEKLETLITERKAQLAALHEAQDEQKLARDGLTVRVKVWCSLTHRQRSALANKASVHPETVQKAVEVLLREEEEPVVLTIFGTVKAELLKKLGLRRHRGGKRDTASRSLLVVSPRDLNAVQAQLKAAGLQLSRPRSQGSQNPRMGTLGEACASEFAQLRKQLS